MLIDEHKVKQIVLDAWKTVSVELDNVKVFTKGRADFVTQTDLNIQRYIKEALYEAYPQMGFMGEEENTNVGSDSVRWILDPIDGTTNYIYHYNHSAISLGLKGESGILFGVVYNPFTGELFSAMKGKGAFLNDSPIHVTDTETLDDALIAIGTSPYNKELAPDVFRKIEKLYGRVLDIRRTGSSALDLAYVACGRLDAYFEYRLKPWDYAAGDIILSEAGGVMRGIGGNQISYERASDVVAGANEKLIGEMLEVLNRSSF